jgi:dynein heavy chain
LPAAPPSRLQDLETYKKSAVAVAKKYFTINDIDDFYKKKDARPLIFCHFARGLSDKTYDEVCEGWVGGCGCT